MALVSSELKARRGHGRFAASSRLDAGLQFTLTQPATNVTITFRLKRGPSAPAELVRILTIPSLNAGPHAVWLSDRGLFFSLNGLEPISAYSLHVERVELTVGQGPPSVFNNPAPPITKLEPLDLGEEVGLPLRSPGWQFSHAAPLLRAPNPLRSDSTGLGMRWQPVEPGRWPAFGAWGFYDTATTALHHVPGMLYRFRFRMRTAQGIWSDTRGMRLRSSLTGGKDVQTLRLLGRAVAGSYATPPPGQNAWREYTLFVHHRAFPGADRFVMPFVEMVSDQNEGSFRPGQVWLSEAAVSRVDPEQLDWMKTIEWNFSTSPQAGGWTKDFAAPAAAVMVAYWQTRWTELNLLDGTHRHGLAIEQTATPPEPVQGGWLMSNIFQFRVPNGQGGVTVQGGYDYRSRLLRVELTVRCSVPGDAAPSIMFGLEVNGFRHEYLVMGLYNEDGTPVPAEQETLVVFYCAPEHHALRTNNVEVDKQINFRFHLLTNRAGSDPRATVVLDNLRVYETLIGDLPSGTSYKTYQDNWPQISIPKAVPDTARVVSPTPDSCPVETVPPLRSYLCNDHGWALSGNTWHLYGIYESGVAIKPMPPGPRPDKTPSNTIGNTSYFVSGLAHVQLCANALGLHTDAGPTEFLDYFRQQPPADPAKEMRVPIGPGEVWNLWAPTIVEYQGAFWMFYSSNWGNEIWLAKTTSGDLSVASWQYTNRDGTLPGNGTARIPVVPAGTPQTGRDFTIVRSSDSQNNVTWHGYWNGGSAIQVFHITATNPLSFDGSQGQPVYSLYNSDSGRLDVDSESVFTLYDANTGNYYLTVSKDGNLAPNWFVGTTFILDYDQRAIVAADPISGDRSIVISNSNKTDPAQPDLLAPYDVCSLDINGPLGNSSSVVTGGAEVRAGALVADGGAGPGDGRLVACLLRNGKRWIFSGPGVGNGPPIQLPGRIARATFPDPNSDVEAIRFFVTDRADANSSGGRVLMIDGGSQTKIRSNFIGQFGEVIQPASGDRSILLEGLSDPTSLFYDAAPDANGQLYLWVCCRTEGTIRRVNITSLPTNLPVQSQVFAGGISNPFFIADGIDRVYILSGLPGNWQISWFMKDQSANGVVPKDPQLPLVQPVAIQFNFNLFGSAGQALLVVDQGQGGNNPRIIWLSLPSGKATLLLDRTKGYGPLGRISAISQGLIYDELDDLVVKVYWSKDPAKFDQYGYIASMQHHAAEWTCDVTQPGHPWYFSYTDYRRRHLPDGREILFFPGWGVEQVVWQPPIADPV